MSEPTPVISSTKQIDSGSSSSATSTWKRATAIQEYRCTSWLRWAAGIAEHRDKAGKPVAERRKRGSHPEQVPPAIGTAAAEQQHSRPEQRERQHQPRPRAPRR